MAINIIFDSLGAQVEENHVTNGARLSTWLGLLQNAGYNVSFTDPFLTISSQLGSNSLLITTTHQFLGATKPSPGQSPNTIPPIISGYVASDLGRLQNWIFNEGGNLLLFVNHSYGLGDKRGPFWPLNDIQLTAALGITTTFAVFTGDVTVSTGCSDNPTLQTLSMTPATLPASNPASAILNGVSQLQAWDSGGINPIVPSGLTSTVLVPLPTSGCTDMSGLGYNPADYAFAVLYQCGRGKVIVVGHSGIVGNAGTCTPSPGQIGAADNQTFLMNCVQYLTS